MLLPAQIQGHQFQMTRGMYKAGEVDNFLSDVFTSYDQMFRENGDLIKKLELLAQKVEEYRKDEDNIRIALLTAQRMADQITREARQSAEELTEKARKETSALEAELQQKATRLLSEAEQTASSTVAKANAVAESTLAQAKMESERILGGVKKEVVSEQAVLDQMKKEVSEFRSKLMGMYKEHIERINDMPSYLPAEKEEPVSSPEPEVQEAPAAEEAETVRETPVLSETPAAEFEAEEWAEEEPAPQETSAASPTVSLRDMVNEAYAEVEKQKEPSTEQKPEYKPKAGGFQVRVDQLDESEVTHTLPKFQNLKFGDNYDISADADEDEDEKSKKGFFRKK